MDQESVGDGPPNKKDKSLSWKLNNIEGYFGVFEYILIFKIPAGPEKGGNDA